jgi:hypothetical protein
MAHPSQCSVACGLPSEAQPVGLRLVDGLEEIAVGLHGGEMLADYLSGCETSLA